MKEIKYHYIDKKNQYSLQKCKAQIWVIRNVYLFSRKQYGKIILNLDLYNVCIIVNSLTGSSSDEEIVRLKLMIIWFKYIFLAGKKWNKIVQELLYYYYYYY